MDEKLFKKIKHSGILNLTLGILILIFCVVSGIMLIVNGARLLSQGSGVLNLTLGILMLIFGIVSGVMLIVNGGRLLAHKSDRLF